MIRECFNPQSWATVKWRNIPYVIDIFKIVAFGPMKEPGELWFQLEGDTSDRCCEMSMADFCALVHSEYKQV